MEKKKLLLVAISVGVFLVIAIGAAILVFSPKNTAVSSAAISSRPVTGTGTGITVPPPSTPYPPVALGTPGPGDAENSQPAPLDPVGLVRNPGDIPGLTPPPAGSVQQEDFHVSGSNGETVISVPKPSSAAIPDAPPVRRVTAAPPAPASKSAPVPKPAAQPKPAVQTKVYDDFWVQTGAFSTIARAEGVKETLAAKGITSIIENRDVDGKTLFRVRVGPYISQTEADYWLSLIKSLDGFEESQVRQTQSKR